MCFQQIHFRCLSRNQGYGLQSLADLHGEVPTISPSFRLSSPNCDMNTGESDGTSGLQTRTSGSGRLACALWRGTRYEQSCRKVLGSLAIGLLAGPGL